MSAKDARALARSRGVKIEKRGRWRAQKSTVDGIKFDSSTERALFEHLRRECDEAIIVPKPTIRLTLFGDKNAPRWTPDFLVTRKVPMIADGYYVEIEIHEAKGAKGLDSRDYILRRKAFEKMFPWIVVYEWRLERRKNPRLIQTYRTERP